MANSPENRPSESYLSEQTLDRMTEERLNGLADRFTTRIKVMEAKGSLDETEQQILNGLKADLEAVKKAI